MSADSDPKRYYIFSAKHTKSTAAVLTWWRPNGYGYTQDLDEAGVYDEEETREICEPSRGGCVAVPVEVARRFTSTTVAGFLVSQMIEARDRMAAKGSP